MLYDVVLSNRSCIFDSAHGLSFEDAIEFARGRGGVYVMQISREGSEHGSSYSYNSDTDSFRSQNEWGEWSPIDPEGIRKEL